jgi:hypothetical protein
VLGGAAFEAPKHQAGARARCCQRVGVLVAFDKSEVIRPRKFEWRNICNQMRKSCCIMAFGTRQQNDVGYRQACGAIGESAISHIQALLKNDHGITGNRVLGNLHRQSYYHTVAESDLRPVKQREGRQHKEYDGIET